MKTTNIYLFNLGTAAFIFGFLIALIINYNIEFISYSEFEDMVYNEETMIVELWAEWNKDNQSKNLQYVENVNKYRINVDIYPEIIDDYNIKSIPTFLFIKDGEEIHRYEAGINFKGDLEVSDFKQIMGSDY